MTWMASLERPTEVSKINEAIDQITVHSKTLSSEEMQQLATAKEAAKVLSKTIGGSKQYIFMQGHAEDAEHIGAIAPPSVTVTVSQSNI